MEKRILLCVDADLSPATQYALRVIGELLEQGIPRASLLLLHVIPVIQPIAPHPGIYAAQVFPASATSWQRELAEETLRKARQALQQQGVKSEYIEEAIRLGAPAEEIVKEARASQVLLIVIGSRGDSWWQRARRVLLGSVSRRVLRLAPCPVMIVNAPQLSRPSDLVSWYETAITHYLSEHPSALSVFTPRQVVQQFALPNKKAPGRKEIAAATLALEQLVHTGRLCRHDVKGELRYVND